MDFLLLVVTAGPLDLGLIHHKKGQSGKHCLSYSCTASFQILQTLTLFTTPRKCKALFNLPLALLKHVEGRALHIPDLITRWT